jgi:predicted nucleic-acid-binding Zn-ribbon protein
MGEALRCAVCGAPAEWVLVESPMHGRLFTPVCPRCLEEARGLFGELSLEAEALSATGGGLARLVEVANAKYRLAEERLERCLDEVSRARAGAPRASAARVEGLLPGGETYRVRVAGLPGGLSPVIFYVWRCPHCGAERHAFTPKALARKAERHMGRHVDEEGWSR